MKRFRVPELERRAGLITGKTCLVYGRAGLKAEKVWGKVRKTAHGIYEIRLDTSLFTRPQIENEFSISEVFYHEVAHIVAGDLGIPREKRHPERERRADVLGAILELEHGAISVEDALRQGIKKLPVQERKTRWA